MIHIVEALFWDLSFSDAHVLPSCLPVPLKSEEAATDEGPEDEDVRRTASGHASQWNRGGTYEEKNVTEK